LKKIVTSSDISHTSPRASRNLPVLAHQTGQEETAVSEWVPGVTMVGERPSKGRLVLLWPGLREIQNSLIPRSTYDGSVFSGSCARHWYTLWRFRDITVTERSKWCAV